MEPNEYHRHPLWTAVTGLGEAIERVPDPKDEDGLHTLQRVRATLDELDQRRALNPYLVDEPMCDQLETGTDAVLAAMSDYADDPEGSAAQLDTAVAQTSQVLAQLRTWPTPPADTATRATKAAASKFNTSVDEMIGTLSKKADGLAKRLEEIDSDGKECAEVANATLDQLRSDIEQSRQDVSSLAERLSAQIDSQRTAFEAESQQRSTSFDREVADLRTAVKEQTDSLAQRSQESHDAQLAKAEEVLAALNKHEERARALLDSTSRHAIAGDYGKWAARQALIAIIWTVVAVVVGLSTAVALLLAIGSAADDSIQFTLYKTGVSVIGLIVAGYCARQAAEHRREERIAKRLHLDLNALEPFLEQVENPEKLRTEIARRVFVPEQSASPEQAPRFAIPRGLSVREVTALAAVLKTPPSS